jgi:hypothetical protein
MRITKPLPYCVFFLVSYIFLSGYSFGQYGDVKPWTKPNPLDEYNGGAGRSQYSKSNSGGMADKIINQQNSLNYHNVDKTPLPPSDPNARDKFIRKQAAQTTLNDKKKQQILLVKSLMEEDNVYPETPRDEIYLTKKTSFQKAFNLLLQMKAGKIPYSLKDAVFIVENACNEKTITYSEYCSLITQKTDLCKWLLKKKKSNGNLAGNLVIQKLYSEKIVDERDSIPKTIFPYKYDFNDFMGKKDITKQFVTKLIKTGTGQCHSMPLLYLILAEELNTMAYLSYAPEHSFIRFSDKTGTLYNFETTNGSLVSDSWLLQSGYVNTMAIKSKIYMDTLNGKHLLNQCLGDLIIYYTQILGYDKLTEQMTKTLLKWNGSNLTGLILSSDLTTIKFKQEAKKVGNPKVEDFPSYPVLNSLYNQLMTQYDYIDNLGYQAMPIEVYEKWLKSAGDIKSNAERTQLKTKLTNSAIENN